MRQNSVVTWSKNSLNQSFWNSVLSLFCFMLANCKCKSVQCMTCANTLSTTADWERERKFIYALGKFLALTNAYPSTTFSSTITKKHKSQRHKSQKEKTISSTNNSKPLFYFGSSLEIFAQTIKFVYLNKKQLF